MTTANPNLEFLMEAKGSEWLQTAIIRTSATTVLSRSERFDLVIGSGRKGQTYLYWDNNELFQLPVSYWAEIHRWINSPGYVDGYASFERPIDARCLECHATSVKSQPPPINRYDRESLVVGISCTKCHESIDGQHPNKLSRQQQMDLCSLCHAGIGNSRTPPGTFRPGDRIANHLNFPMVETGGPLDVHANQVGLLAQSRCFQKSPALSCTTCHDVHVTQRDPSIFSRQCLSCHEPKQCGQFKTQGAGILTRCVECHMPLQETAQIVSTTDGILLRPKVRNHRIAIYAARNAP